MSSTAEQLHCPHCGWALDPAPGPAGCRCQTCRLVVGPGRAVPPEQARQVAMVSTAGLQSSAARRAGAVPVERQLVIDSLRRVARQRGRSVGRLRMVDYELARQQDPSLVGLEDVYATFGSWKQARAAAQRLEPQTGDGAAAD